MLPKIALPAERTVAVRVLTGTLLALLASLLVQPVPSAQATIAQTRECVPFQDRGCGNRGNACLYVDTLANLQSRDPYAPCVVRPRVLWTLLTSSNQNYANIKVTRITWKRWGAHRSVGRGEGRHCRSMSELGGFDCGPVLRAKVIVKGRAPTACGDAVGKPYWYPWISIKLSGRARVSNTKNWAIPC
jgi:hypothetical protein